MALRHKTFELPVRTRSANVQPSSLNEETRTVTVVVSTGARRVMRTWDGDIEEELPITEEALDLARMNSVAPVLDNHRQFASVLSTLGAVVEGSARIENGQLVCEIRFATTEWGTAALQLVKDGTIRAVSVGYDAQYSLIRARDRQDGGTMDLWTAVRWEPYEVSLVGMPADAGAKIRGEEPRTTRTYRVQYEETDPMADRQKADASTGAAPEKTAPTGAENNDTVLRGVQLVTQTRSMLKRVGLDESKAESLVTEHRGDESAINRTILDLMAEESARTRTRGYVSVGTEEADHGANAIRAAFVQGMVERMSTDTAKEVRTKLQTVKGSGIERSDELVRGLRSIGLLGMARHFLRGRGMNPDLMSKSQIADAILGARSAGGMHATGDFPLLLAGGAETILLAKLEAERSPITEFYRRRDLPDFRTVTLARRGDGPALLPLPAGGEIQRGSISESGEEVRMQRRARGFSLDRIMIINDNLGAFSDGVETMMESVRDSRQEILEAPFIDNPTLKDGDTLFSASKGTDLTSAYGAPSTTMIHAMGALMARQIEEIDAGIGTKKRRLTRRPKAFVAGYDEAVVLDLLLNAEYTAATAATGRSPRFRNMPVYDVNALLDITHRPYFAVDAADSGLVYGMLEGAMGPTVRQEDGFWQDGVSFAVIDDFYSGVESRGGVVRARISDPG